MRYHPYHAHSVAGLADFYRLPHIQFFDSFMDLVAQLQATSEQKLEELSGLMRDVNDEHTKGVLRFWEDVLLHMRS